MSDNKAVVAVQVAIRVRPLVKRELKEGARPYLKCFLNTNQIALDNRIFNFDYVFDETNEQEHIYNACAAPLVEKLFNGYNCTIFAYGQTGSGKTHTMGTEQTLTHSESMDRGIIPRIIESIFGHSAEIATEFDVRVTCSMLEIYKEEVMDLLGEREALQIRETAPSTIFVQNLTENHVEDLESTMRLLERGCAVRSKGETAMNLRSSRSHALFTIYIRKTSKFSGDSCQAKLHLVDLAGSERLKKTQAEGDRRLEGIRINEGLLALGNVISALTDTTCQRTHVPYRDSKLTRLLQDSLGGNSLTVMITCVSPADSNYEETLSSLRYAERAKRIKNRPTVNLDSDSAALVLLREEIQRLQRQLVEARNTNSGTSCTEGNAGDIDELHREIEHLQKENQRLNVETSAFVAEKASLLTQLAMAECQRDSFKDRVEEMKRKLNNNISSLNSTLFTEDNVRQHLDAMRDLHKELDTLQDEEQPSFIHDSSAVKQEEHGDEHDAEAEAEDMSQIIARQGAVARQMEDLMKQIKQKEELIKQTATNSDQIDKMREQHANQVAELREKIEYLQHERDEISRQLQTVQSTTAKVSEARRKRLQELEKQLTEYKKKYQEAQKYDRLKAQSDQAIKGLRTEVDSLKQLRVKLMRQMRSDNDTYRKWKLKSDQQMNMLRQKEKRQEMEAEKTKRNFNQQLNIYRRKYEEAMTVSKRLQQQLMRQQTSISNRFAGIQDNEKLTKEIKDFVEQELDIIGSTEEARLCCENLIQQRKLLTEKLRTMKKKRKRVEDHHRSLPPIKKQNLGDGEYTAEDTVSAIDAKIKSLEEEIEMRNVEIQQLQQKATVLDTDVKETTRWANIHTIVHAKCALNALFSAASNIRTDNVHLKCQLGDLKTKKQELNALLRKRKETIDVLQNQIDALECEKIDAIDQCERDHQNKVAHLLSELLKLYKEECVNQSDIQKLLTHCDMANSMQKLTEQLERKDEECKHLSKELSVAKLRSVGKKELFSRLSTIPTSAEKQMPYVCNKDELRTRSRIIRTTQFMGAKPIGLNFDDSATADDSSDLDYINTPIGKKKKHSFFGGVEGCMKKRRTTANADVTTGGCSCRTGCTQRCGCRRKAATCSDDCSCEANRCQNRSGTVSVLKEESNSSTENDEPHKLDVTFVSKPSTALFKPMQSVDNVNSPEPEANKSPMATMGIAAKMMTPRGPLFKSVYDSQC